MWNTFFEGELAALDERGLRRDLLPLPETGGEIALNSHKVLNFSSNDYLALARDPRLKAAAVQAIESLGCGATASRLMAGHLQMHEALEADLAAMLDTEAALVFGSGYLTNLGVLSTLAGPGDAIFSDWLNHASLIDGARLSQARRIRYRHLDLDHLESLLKESPPTGKRLIVSESIFSMDGDIAPVAALADLARRHRAMLIIDEAHAIGVMGKAGGGVCRLPGREVHPDIVIGTLSKALGGYGGFVAGSASLRHLLINKARSFIYSTGLPPGCLGSARQAVAIVGATPQLGEDLRRKARWLHDRLVERGLRLPEAESQILPILVGDNAVAVAFSKHLWEGGLLIRAVRPPTVPAGTARVRLSITLALSDAALHRAADIISKAARDVGLV